MAVTRHLVVSACADAHIEMPVSIHCACRLWQARLSETKPRQHEEHVTRSLKHDQAATQSLETNGAKQRIPSRRIPSPNSDL